MDNMIAQGKAKPMIVIMPNGIVDLDAAPGQSPYMQGKASRSNVSSWMGRTEKAFSEEIIPFVEKRLGLSLTSNIELLPVFQWEGYIQ